jgi:hypothetical protein
MLRNLALSSVLVLTAAPTVTAQSTGEPGACSPAAGEAPTAQARTDQQVTGNRVAAACGPLRGDVVDIEIAGTPSWVVPDPSDNGGSWFVMLDDGSVDHVIAPEGLAPSVVRNETAPLQPGEPPMALAMDDGQVLFGSALDPAAWFEDPLPGTRVVELPDGVQAALTGPSARYSHGVLGDELEASAITLRDTAGGSTVIEVAAPDVIEGLSPMVADLDGDGTPEIIVTVSNAEVGARLVAYGLDGEIVAQSDPIGRGYRWLHQVAAGPLGSDGEIEIVVVRTPHIGGVVETYRLIDGHLELAASQVGYSSHRLGSSNLDMALMADADGDGRLDVIVPTQDMTALGVLARTADGFEEVASLPLEGRLMTNVAAATDAEGHLVLAAGTDDGRLRIYR